MTHGQDIKRVLATVPYGDAELGRLRAAFAPTEVISVSPRDNEGIAEALEQVDVAVILGDLDHRRCPNCRSSRPWSSRYGKPR
ncbi:hypothetical protein [Streptomyces sp. NL15-2K]|uniref:hypothetical protein n=1 Tax=Streptomyces sp. NL15-2K TaxID=376149 RepID=UPI000F58A9DF|nr:MULTISPECIES: hypothetical protein [Actinomycetes]WKX15446.1 hypothetical protein Q4V64_51310 [Kutzneria buriramensis]GCB52631.1 hypothetical protein SNL152K_9988 [Streptomyces sp. NL15-2K]